MDVVDWMESPPNCGLQFKNQAKSVKESVDSVKMVFLLVLGIGTLFSTGQKYFGQKRKFLN